MKVVKILAILLVVYVALVATFESLLGYYQPEGQTTLTITTFDGDGEAHERVLSRIEEDSQLYVAVNHWPRAWYYRALENPDVQVALDGEKRDYRAVPVSDEEHDRLAEEHALGWTARILMGFPPRYFLRLEPK